MNFKIDAPVLFQVTAFTPLHLLAGQSDYDALVICGIGLAQVQHAIVQTKNGEIPLKFDFINDSQISIPIGELNKAPSNAAFFVLLVDSHDGWFPVGPIISTITNPLGDKDDIEDSDNDISV